MHCMRVTHHFNWYLKDNLARASGTIAFVSVGKFIDLSADGHVNSLNLAMCVAAAASGHAASITVLHCETGIHGTMMQVSL